MYIKDVSLNTRYPIEDIIHRFGKQHLKECMSKNMYQIWLQEDIKDVLLEKRFHKKSLNTAVKNLKNGHDIENLVKLTGKVKKNTQSFNITVDKMDVRQNFMNRIILSQAKAIFKKAYLRRFEDVDTKVDPITCEEIKMPCFIRTDWKNGNRVVYDVETIIECRETIRLPYAFDVINGEDVTYYAKYYTEYFISPMTRAKFKVDDIVRLYL
tara:strand:+ start:4394 stop:5026 length:633 start_codon:yes stop_codon:yes gene_type:complete